MAVFHIKTIHDAPVNGPISWTFDRAELIADGVVHVFGISLSLFAIALWMTELTAGTDRTIYVIVLITMFTLSAMYNLWPVSPSKWLLRRFDHSVIYLLIAATYTPFVSQIPDRKFAIVFLIGVWSVAIAGAILKLNFPGRFDRLSIGLYLAMGWSGIFAYGKAAAVLPSSTLLLIVAGGTLYTLGVLFHSWERLRFQNAIWHGFVLLAAGCHFAAVVGLETA